MMGCWNPICLLELLQVEEALGGVVDSQQMGSHGSAPPKIALLPVLPIRQPLEMPHFAAQAADGAAVWLTRVNLDALEPTSSLLFHW
eukprot:CAMPEP_0177786308 /NCGR_PEP_ID=MMETSP0491_2-20121128/20847_1 /TAXON_ID=63592 /ORGANISM="Tetraselmis chuii, Strain PLY429" /LENGTH=86 /DNA_ID=CAMNT_0019307497 /DNA_START=35 /DNA_END=295 /DNA_ORIENTATION=+